MKLKFSKDKQYLDIIESTDDELSQIKFFLKRRIHNWMFHPMVKKKLWDGYINFLTRSNKIPAGLWNEMEYISDECGYEFELEGLDEFMDSNFDETHFFLWVDKLFENSELKPRDYQASACAKILNYKRCVSEIATAAGKTLIMYIVNSYLKDHKNYKKFLIIVPNISLIEQTVEKFEQYSENLDIKWKCQMILSGESKKIKPDCNIVIGTYQSLVKLPKEFFSDIDCVCVDESHFAKVKSINTIFGHLGHVEFRYGLSGTSKVKNTRTAESFTIQSLLGPIIDKIKSIDLSNQGYTTPVKIKMIEMNYLEDSEKMKLKKIKSNKSFDRAKLLNLERKLAIGNPLRTKFILKIIQQVKNNSLVLFHNVKEGYGKHIYSKLQKIFESDDRFRIFYVDGSTPKDKRDFIRQEANKTDYISIIIASFGVFSTGIDIPNIFNIFLLESFKSEVIIKQTLGRGMRNFKGKSSVLIFDFVDDFRIDNYTNYLYNHSNERRLLYNEERFDYSIISKNLLMTEKKLF